MFIPYVSIRCDSITIFDLWDGERFRNDSSFKLNHNAYARSHGLTLKSASKLKAAVNALVFSARWKTVWVKKTNSFFRYKITFITLTLPSPQVHSDKEILTKCLVPFLQKWAKRRAGLLYVWKAEVQENGNLHFHITANAFYHYKKLKRDWNRQLNELGYIDRCKVSEPNSTDVHSVSKINNLAAYLVAYVSKKDSHTKVLKRWLKLHRVALADQNREVVNLPKKYFKHIKRVVGCRLWAASKALLNAKVSLHRETTGISFELNRLLQIKEAWHQRDYSATAYLEPDLLPNLKHMYSAFKGANPELYAMQKKSVIKEEIESL